MITCNIDPWNAKWNFTRFSSVSSSDWKVTKNINIKIAGKYCRNWQIYNKNMYKMLLSFCSWKQDKKILYCWLLFGNRCPGSCYLGTYLWYMYLGKRRKMVTLRRSTQISFIIYNTFFSYKRIFLRLDFFLPPLEHFTLWYHKWSDEIYIFSIFFYILSFRN
jgi:hypothetical protein